MICNEPRRSGAPKVIAPRSARLQVGDKARRPDQVGDVLVAVALRVEANDRRHEHCTTRSRRCRRAAGHRSATLPSPPRNWESRERSVSTARASPQLSLRAVGDLAPRSRVARRGFLPGSLQPIDEIRRPTRVENHDPDGRQLAPTSSRPCALPMAENQTHPAAASDAERRPAVAANRQRMVARREPLRRRSLWPDPRGDSRRLAQSRSVARNERRREPRGGA